METPTRKYKKHKEGYAISINYYLRKEKGNSLLDLFANKQKHPLSIRVSFFQQTVKIRSRLGVRLTEEEFNEYMKRPHVIEFVEVETSTIKKSIQQLNPELKTDFRISEWFQYYESKNESLFSLANRVVKERFNKIAASDANETEVEKGIGDVVIGTGLLGVKMLALRFKSEPAKLLYDKYKYMIDILMSNLWSLNHIGYTMWDWELGTLQAMIERKYGDDANTILSLFEEVIAEYETLTGNDD